MRETHTEDTTTYTYDQANRLTDYNGVGQYEYNGDGLRMYKGVGGHNPGTPALPQCSQRLMMFYK